MYRLLSHSLPILALIVIVAGAYVRLSDAGLGCPDWPGCYGQIGVPTTAAEINAANTNFQQRPVEQGKAWREMGHRYIAALLGLGIVVLMVASWIGETYRGQRWLTTALFALVLFQGALGMWTVTLLLKPLIVVAHLLGGLCVLSLLWWHLLRIKGVMPVTAGSIDGRSARRWMNIAIGVLVFQIFLGGWTSSNYAALACTDFPTCHGSWWPQMDFAEGFTLWRGLQMNYEFGVLDTPARTAVHYTHRIWALVTVFVLVMVALRSLKQQHPACRQVAWCIILLTAIQATLGITNVLQGLPLAVAVSHNGGAAILLLAVLTLRYLNSNNQNTMIAQ